MHALVGLLHSSHLLKSVRSSQYITELLNLLQFRTFFESPTQKSQGRVNLLITSHFTPFLEAQCNSLIRCVQSADGTMPVLWYTMESIQGRVITHEFIKQLTSVNADENSCEENQLGTCEASNKQKTFHPSYEVFQRRFLIKFIYIYIV